jgi:hypothetical protein
MKRARLLVTASLIISSTILNKHVLTQASRLRHLCLRHGLVLVVSGPGGHYWFWENVGGILFSEGLVFEKIT